ncbi:MAG: acetate/propionate family kinase [Betaproteobacteria bacterium]|nr:MAG: acetate/propionate family kinase [Betaproteobacteria bacterium]
MHSQILVLNAGSSSIKFAVFATGDPLQRTVQGMISGIGSAGTFTAHRNRQPLPGTLPASNLTHETALAWLFDWLDAGAHASHLVGAGHRVVHGGEHHDAPVIVNAHNLAELDALAPLAPLHQPHNLAAIKALLKLRPALRQVACFDTAFHRSQPAVAQTFALPRAVTAGGLRRYGFHGLSYEFIADALPEAIGDQADARVIVAHLGNGASLCAMHQRKSVATTMGFSTLDGLVMGTRCGTIDPGALFFLMHERRMSSTAVENMLYRESGLLGISGISNDMRTLLHSADPRASEAIASFVHRAVLETGALAAALQGMDALVFTGGIGEHAAPIRALICEKLGWLGIDLDAAANARHATRISAAGSGITVCVIPTDEEAVIARHADRLLRTAA